MPSVQAKETQFYEPQEWNVEFRCPCGEKISFLSTQYEVGKPNRVVCTSCYRVTQIRIDFILKQDFK